MSRVLQKLAGERHGRGEAGVAGKKRKRDESAVQLDVQPKLDDRLRPVSAASAAASGKKVSKEVVDSGSSSIVYLGHIPRAFEEAELQKFFRQFGKVQRLKLFRSAKTGNPRGHAFIQFDDPQVASVVAQSMDGYFLAERKLVCHVVPTEKHHKNMFKKPRSKASADVTAEEDEDEDVPEITVDDATLRKHSAAQQRKEKQLRALGIDISLPLASMDGQSTAEGNKDAVSETAAPVVAPKTKKSKTKA